MDKRLELLKQYLSSVFTDFTISKVSEDASFRRYFRIVIHNKSNFVVMDAPPLKEKIDGFVAIAKFFKVNNINTPKIYHQNLKLGFLVLEDFGDITLLKNNTINFYKLAIDELIKIQQLPQNDLPIYSHQILQKEMEISKEWFCNDFNYKDIFKFLLENIQQHKSVVVHRDYHSRNIMVYDNMLGIIDFQDAIFGSYVYDIASLLRDAYLEIDNVEVLQKYYFQQAELTNYQQFIQDFDMIATQRHLKILGIL